MSPTGKDKPIVFVSHVEEAAVVASHFDPTLINMEDVEPLGEVIFCDKIGRKIK